MLFPIFLLAFGVSSVSATFTSWEGGCKLLPEDTRFVESPEIRGSLQILWTSLATIFLCTYTLLHLDVPEQRDGRGSRILGGLEWVLKGVWYKVKWMCIIIVMPEIYTVIAFDDRRQAANLKQDVKSAGLEKWSETHRYMANMGGFGIRVIPERMQEKADEEKLIDGYKGYIQHLTASQIISLTRMGWLKDISTIMQEELQDKSKHDALTKLILFMQLSTFTLAVLTRAIRHLPITLLELGTLSFVALSFLAGMLQFDKPQDVNTVIILKSLEPSDAKASEVCKILLQDDLEHPVNDKEDARPIVFGRTSHPREIRMRRLLTFGMDTKATLFFLLVSGCFGAVHLIGWRFAFPSYPEHVLWWAASLMASSGLVLGIGGVIVALFIAEKIENKIHNLLIDTFGYATVICTGIWCIAFCCARVYLIVEMFRSLAYLPPGAFEDTWVMNLPSIS